MRDFDGKIVLVTGASTGLGAALAVGAAARGAKAVIINYAKSQAEAEATAEAVVTACLERIAAREPVVGAWAHLDPAYAIDQARRRDRSPPLGPLHGVPVAVKDIFDTADMPTGMGSAVYAGYQPRADASAVAIVRAAGAVVLGKTVTTEFAAGDAGTLEGGGAVRADDVARARRGVGDGVEVEDVGAEAADQDVGLPAAVERGARRANDRGLAAAGKRLELLDERVGGSGANGGRRHLFKSVARRLTFHL